MPIINFQINATLENVAKLYAPQAMFWRIKFACQMCREKTNSFIEFSAEDKSPSGRGIFNVTSKCGFCGRLRTVDVVENSNAPYLQNDQGYKTILKLDCRGMIPEVYSPGEGWVVEAENSGETFIDVDLSETEWVEYDSKKKCPISIYGFKYRFVKE